MVCIIHIKLHKMLQKNLNEHFGQLYICMCIYMYIYIFVYTYTHIHTHTHIAESLCCTPATNIML